MLGWVNDNADGTVYARTMERNVEPNPFGKYVPHEKELRHFGARCQAVSVSLVRPKVFFFRPKVYFLYVTLSYRTSSLRPLLLTLCFPPFISQAPRPSPSESCHTAKRSSIVNPASSVVVVAATTSTCSPLNRRRFPSRRDRSYNLAKIVF